MENEIIDAGAKRLPKRNKKIRTPPKHGMYLIECPYKEQAKCSRLFVTLTQIHAHVRRAHKQFDDAKQAKGTQNVFK